MKRLNVLLQTDCNGEPTLQHVNLLRQTMTADDDDDDDDDDDVYGNAQHNNYLLIMVCVVTVLLFTFCNTITLWVTLTVTQ